jgi:hypothetical protein
VTGCWKALRLFGLPELSVYLQRTDPPTINLFSEATAEYCNHAFDQRNEDGLVRSFLLSNGLAEGYHLHKALAPSYILATSST